MSTSSPWVPERGEVIFIEFNPQAGKEMPDLHPMLVFSARAFAEKTGLVAGFPMTHAAGHASNPFAVKTVDPKGAPSYVLTHQPKSFDWRARNAKPHPMGTGHTKLLAEALELFNDVFSIC